MTPGRFIHARHRFTGLAICDAPRLEGPSLSHESFRHWCEAWDALERETDATPPCVHCRAIVGIPTGKGAHHGA